MDSLSPRTVGSLLTKHYGISLIGRPQIVARGTQGNKAIVRTDIGPVLIRRVPTVDYCDRDFACEWQSIVGSTDLAPSICRTTSNHLFLQDGGTTIVVEEYIQGAPRDLARSDGPTLGHALAHLHAAGAGSAKHRSQASTWRALAEMTWTSVSMRASSVGEDRVVAELCDRGRVALSRLEQLPADVPSGVHGDVNPSNLLWTGAHVVFCDFVNACPLPQMIDLAMAIVGCGVLRWDLVAGVEIVPEHLPTGMTLFVRGFVASYEAIRPLSRDETTLMPDALWFVSARWLPWLRFRSPEHAVQFLMCIGNVTDHWRHSRGE